MLKNIKIKYTNLGFSDAEFVVSTISNSLRTVSLGALLDPLTVEAFIKNPSDPDAYKRGLVFAKIAAIRQKFERDEENEERLRCGGCTVEEEEESWIESRRAPDGEGGGTVLEFVKGLKKKPKGKSPLK